MEIATRNVIFPGSVGLAQAHPLTKPLAMGDGLPPDLVKLRSTLPIRALVLGGYYIIVIIYSTQLPFGVGFEMRSILAQKQMLLRGLWAITRVADIVG